MFANLAAAAFLNLTSANFTTVITTCPSGAFEV